MSSALRIRARWTTAALQVETVEVVGHPLQATTDALMTTDEPGLSSGKGYTAKQRHMAAHIEEGYEQRGIS
jgi:hypothetical protein